MKKIALFVYLLISSCSTRTYDYNYTEKNIDNPIQEKGIILHNTNISTRQVLDKLVLDIEVKDETGISDLALTFFRTVKPTIHISYPNTPTHIKTNITVILSNCQYQNTTYPNPKTGQYPVRIQYTNTKNIGFQKDFNFNLAVASVHPIIKHPPKLPLLPIWDLNDKMTIIAAPSGAVMRSISIKTNGYISINRPVDPKTQQVSIPMIQIDNIFPSSPSTYTIELVSHTSSPDRTVFITNITLRRQ